MLIMSYIGDHVWLMTSRHTLPDLHTQSQPDMLRTLEEADEYNSSMLGWNMRFTKPMLGLLYGYWSGSSTWTFHRPPAKGAVRVS